MRRRNKWDCLSNTGYDTGVRWAFEGFDMELEGNLVIHRKPARWWAAALAVTLPVLACVAGVAWFIRGYISPPTIHIPGSMAAVQGDSIVGPSTSETSADTPPLPLKRRRVPPWRPLRFFPRRHGPQTPHRHPGLPRSQRL